MRWRCLALGIGLLPALSLIAISANAVDQKNAKFEPVIFGTYQGNVGCVVLKQQYGVRKKWLATGTILAVGEYEVVQAYHYDMGQTKFKGQEGANELNRIAQKERIKFVVIPARFSDYQLNLARDECQKGLPSFVPHAEAIEASRKVETKETSASEGVAAPEAIYKPAAPYTSEAKKAGIEGTVVLWIVVDESGNVSDARISKGLGHGLDDEALKTAKTWKFKPAVKDGKFVPVRVMLEMTFKLK